MKRTIRVVLFAIGCALIAFGLFGCPRSSDFPLPADVPSQAAQACTNLRKLQCPEGNGSPAGKSCTDVLVSAYRLRPLPLACWAMAVDVDHAMACRVDNEPVGELRCQR